MEHMHSKLKIFKVNLNYITLLNDVLFLQSTVTPLVMTSHVTSDSGLENILCQFPHMIVQITSLSYMINPLIY
jgi:hypothetical protein